MIPVVRMEIQTVVMGGINIPSLIVLRPADDSGREACLPIRIGPVEASAITQGIEREDGSRPLTHDLLATTIRALGARLLSVSIVDVRGTTFYAALELVRSDGTQIELDCRPSDAIALAVRAHVAIYVREQVLARATMPDFHQVERDTEEQELKAFHDFVEGLSPEDFD